MFQKAIIAALLPFVFPFVSQARQRRTSPARRESLIKLTQIGDRQIMAA